MERLKKQKLLIEKEEMLNFRKSEILRIIAVAIFIELGVVIALTSSAKPINTNDPIEVAKKIGDKLVDNTPFAYCLAISRDQKQFTGMQMVDFGRNFPLDGPGTAYAYTQLTAPEDMEMEIEIGHNDGCLIWINKELVYKNLSDSELELSYDERSIELPYHFHAKLKKGKNSLLINSITHRKNWKVYIQPPSKKGAVSNETNTYPTIGLDGMNLVNPDIASLSNWLVVGPFGKDNENKKLLQNGQPVFGQVFNGLNGATSWAIPRVEVVGDFINPLPWGTNYHWNYHNGGVAWAMKKLGEISGESKYEKYADDFCDFQLNSIPFLKYETETLGKTNVPNGLLLNTPLLDFTLAPSIPLVYRLLVDPDFKNRTDYVQFIDDMLDYAKNEQIRLPGASNYTRTTPTKYTTWVDDMFMGIPFLVQASLYAEDKDEQQLFLNDATNQVLDFNKEVWDDEANLYVHAKYSDSDEKMVHWSRANGWGIWATTEVLSRLPRNHKNYKSILKHYQAHVESLLKYQHDTGFWHNVLDFPESRPEVSGTAIFTMAIARGVHEGWLKGDKYKKAAQKGWDAICSQIDDDGTVHNICYGTMCSSDVNYYLNRPFYDNDTHGLFAVLFAAMEVSKMQKL